MHDVDEMAGKLVAYAKRNLRCRNALRIVQCTVECRVASREIGDRARSPAVDPEQSLATFRRR
jgi:hypothetical protein